MDKGIDLSEFQKYYQKVFLRFKPDDGLT